MTVIELLIGLSLALVIASASLAVLERASTAQNEVADRQHAAQAGRQAMEDVTRQLRSQVCLGEAAEPIAAGADDSVSFYADLSDGSRNVELRRLTLVPAGGGAPGRLVEEVFAGAGTYPDLQFPATPTRTRVLLASAARARDPSGQPLPLFRYFAFQPGSPTGDLERLPAPLSAEDASRTIMVQVAFAALPERARPRDADATTLESSVYVRLADPSRPLEGPRCI